MGKTRDTGNLTNAVSTDLSNNVTINTLDTGIVKSISGELSNATVDEDYLSPTGTGTGLTDVVHQTGDELNIQGDKQLKDFTVLGDSRSGNKASTISYPVVGAGLNILRFVEYDNKIWAINRDTDNSIYYSSDGISWTQSWDGDDWTSGEEYPYDLCVYNGKLYCTFQSTQSTPISAVSYILEYDSAVGSWIVSKPPTADHTSYLWMLVVGDKMYVAATFGDISSGQNQDRIYEFNGSTYTQVFGSSVIRFSNAPSPSYIHSRGAIYYNGKIYCPGMDNADGGRLKIYEFTPTPGGFPAPTVSYSIAPSYVYMNSSAVVNGILYVAINETSGNTYRLLKFNGTTWSDLGCIGYTDVFGYGNRLFATNNLGHLVCSIDGVNWWVENYNTSPSTRKYGTKGVLNKKLFVSNDTRTNETTYTPSGLADILVYDLRGSVRFSGGVTITENLVSEGDLSILNGNLIIGTLGKGIDFSATSSSAGMSSEILDDYEYGTWTPTAIFSGGNGDLSYGIQVGRYVKVGKVVTCTGYLLFGESTASGNLQIGGLPFQAASISNLLCRFGIGVDNLTGLSGMPTGEIIDSSSVIGVSYTGTGTATSITNSNTSSNAVFRMTFSYITN